MPLLKGDKEMADSKRPPASPASFLVQNRRQFRRLERGSPTLVTGKWGPRLSRPTSANPFSSAASGLFGTLDDECLLLIMQELARIPLNVPITAPIDVKRAVSYAAQSLSGLILSCRRLNGIFDSIGTRLKLEMIARASTQIVPRCLHEEQYPFTAQVHVETRSSQQLQLLKRACESLATHCASACCARVRKEVNRELKRRARASALSFAAPRQSIETAVEHSSVLAATPCGETCFVVTRRREGHKQRREYISKLGFENTKDRAVVVTDAEINIDADDLSRPHAIRTSINGTRAVIIRSTHLLADEDETHDGAEPISIAQTWTPTSGGKLETVVAPDELGEINSAQDAWFGTDQTLHVLFSTAYVHPSGAIVGAKSVAPSFAIATFCEEMASTDVIGPFPGKVQTASPTRNGRHVALLVKSDPKATYDTSHELPTRTTCVFDVLNGTKPQKIEHEAVRRKYNLDALATPTTVAFSPNGDRLVAIHRSASAVIAELLVRADRGFMSIQSFELSCFGRGIAADPFGTETLRLPYSVEYSPCGRFVAIIDQRATFGIAFENASICALDAALHLERRGVRALPLGHVDDVSLRSLSWTDAGLWAQSRHGALFLRSC